MFSFTVEQINSYLNYTFISIIAIAIIVGLMRGLKKTLISFVTRLAYFVLFFLTLDTVVNFLWSFNSPYVGKLLAYVSPNLSSVSSLAEALPQLLLIFIPADYQFALDNANLMLMLSGIGIFAIKLVYTILAFTVIYWIYSLLILIIRSIFFPDRKNNEKYVSKNRG